MGRARRRKTGKRRGRGRGGDQKGRWRKGATKGTVFQICGERRQCNLPAFLSYVHAMTSHRRGIIKHASEWLGHPNEYK